MIRFAVISLLLAASPSSAHDFWLEPVRFQTVPQTDFAVTMQIGHGEFRQRWGNGLERILLLKDFGPNGSRDIRADFRMGGNADIITRFTTEGVHALVLQTAYAQSELPAIRFNDYLKAEGLAVILTARANTGTNGQSGRERYSRRAKALIQVGTATAANSRLATKALGMKLEIVADRNPYALGPDRMLPVHVIYKGQRLAGATVMLTSLEFDAKPIAQTVTDARGQAAFRVPPVGEWLLNVLWSEPIRNDPRADFDTTFSSLTFGYDPGKRTL